MTPVLAFFLYGVATAPNPIGALSALSNRPPVLRGSVTCRAFVLRPARGVPGGWVLRFIWRRGATAYLLAVVPLSSDGPSSAPGAALASSAEGDPVRPAAAERVAAHEHCLLDVR